MALQDLIVSKQKISEDFIERVLQGYVELLQENKRVFLTKKASGLAGKTKVLLLLAGGYAWSLIDNTEWRISPSDMEKDLGISGNTLRPTLKMLSDNYLVSSETGKYSVLPKGIYELEDLLKQSSGTKQNVRAVRRSKRDSQSKSSKTPSKSEIIYEMMRDGFFNLSLSKDLQEIQTELGRRGMSTKATSLPSFLLPMVRKKKLTREQKQKGKRKVWAYKLPKKELI